MAETILIADDHESSLVGLEGLLLLEGFSVFTARDGEAAWAEFHRLKPDMLLLDVQMPKLDGIEVCRRLKDNPETRLVPVVLVTGLTAIQDRVKGIKAGRRFHNQTCRTGAAHCSGSLITEAQGLYGRTGEGRDGVVRTGTQY